MSRVYFHSEHGEAELHGSERAHLGTLVDDITTGFLHHAHDREDQLRSLIVPGHHLHQGGLHVAGGAYAWLDAFRASLTTYGDSPFLAWKGRHVGPFALRLNTALRHGSETIRLAARIHGQCEIHGYVEGANRAWFADRIQQGLDEGVYRAGLWYVDRVCDKPAATQPDRKWADQGWGDVIDLLRTRDDEPVVMSYSVCDGFPNPQAARWSPPPMPDDWTPDWADNPQEWLQETPDRAERLEWYEAQVAEAWWKQPAAQRWDQALDGVRAHPGGLEIEPAEFERGDRFFEHGLTLPDLLADDYAQRLDAAFGVTTPETR